MASTKPAQTPTPSYWNWRGFPNGAGGRSSNRG